MSIFRRKDQFATLNQLIASKCPKCGCRTPLGERYCPRCRARLSYNCPYCNGPGVDNTFVNCPSCRRPLTWDTNTQIIVKAVTNTTTVREQVPATNYREKKAERKHEKPSLLGFLVALGVLALIVAAFIFVIQNM